MTIYFPVWHSHCASAIEFTVLVSCNDELVSASLPAKAGCEACVRTVLLLVCVTITWLQDIKEELLKCVRALARPDQELGVRERFVLYFILYAYKC